ncbi:MAG: hypothetical protein JWR80_6177 [Bradyrhizobium sp.]|nr:hypothetical protein [Bradyrhizobium sp.]
MSEKPKPNPFAEIEKAQEQLRENIEESKQLVEKTQRLLKKAKDQSRPEAPLPAAFAGPPS